MGKSRVLVSSCGKDAPRTPCPLTVWDNQDIGILQAQLTTEERSMVQIASNFNCLENAGKTISADYGHLVEGYATDCTQGPAASFGVPGASLLRCHYAFEDRSQPSTQWGQYLGHEVELLLDVQNYTGRCQNGKLVLTGKEKPVTSDMIDAVAERVRVGLHSDAEVVFTRGSNRRELKVLPEGQRPLVDQVLSASANWNAICVPIPKQNLCNLTRALLRASYSGAYLAAIHRKRSLLLLTFIGGASFGNPVEMILEELVRAHVSFADHPESSLREVRLVVYEKNAKRRMENRVQALLEQCRG